ncbi:short-chain dehydrogenase, putative [Talaromyces stipitatus ATCC 10500]|uniref:Short-chain dehydrogenase, putative n=1 Tax=Talaromyces stipitatus (strain ATCC 10500 / CBS 375.48 / QM 6759 / NRRL 1006) TaxID=441959 RepID=B8MFP7_TALSN|nr:short-chain dehydrogenase, putative [Talaromyces stipitatus ATCC 10500]EED17037.1 short-chain dehydrogenase, putative [Talaromyces stipitatus ATCC 10500]
MTVPQRLLNKVAIVTGSSSGLGRAIALAYSHEGARVVCGDLRPESRPHVVEETAMNTDELIRKNGGSAIFVPTDVGDTEKMECLVNSAVSEFGRLDILVNNAGISVEADDPRPLHTTPNETWDLTMRVNARSVFLGAKFAVTQMLKQEPHRPSGDRGWIINISSIMGSIATEGNPFYCASKGAVSSLTRQIAVEYAKYRIHCNSISPGYTQTAIFAETTGSGMTSLDDLRRKHPFGGPGKPEDIAKFAVVLASDDAAWVSGANMFVDGGYTAR